MSAISEETLSVSGVLLAKVFGNQGRDMAGTGGRTSGWPTWKSASR